VELLEHVPIGRKTTMRIGGEARYFAELRTKADVEHAWQKAMELGVPLVMLGSGSNTIFADGTVQALVAHIAAEQVETNGQLVRAEAGKNLASLIAELAAHDLDLSPLTGIPGTLGGAIAGNAGQGPGGIWMDSYVETVEAYTGKGWQVFHGTECGFAYRESAFKTMRPAPIIWSTVLQVPRRPKAEILADAEQMLKKRMESQPHVRTAGSCFKAAGGTPAWKLIDEAGLRGHQCGGVQVSEKHANFLVNTGNATFEDAKTIVGAIRSRIDHPLSVEMRFIGNDGSPVF